MCPLPRARVKLGGRTRWKKNVWSRDLKSKFEPIGFEEGSTWCICMSYIDKLRNIEEIMHIKWKWPFDSCDPKWPQVDLWPHNIGRGSQANVHVWIEWSCYIQRNGRVIALFRENDLLTPVTPNDPNDFSDSLLWYRVSSWCICMNHMTISCNL